MGSAPGMDCDRVALRACLKSRRRREESLIDALFSREFETPYVVSYGNKLIFNALPRARFENPIIERPPENGSAGASPYRGIFGRARLPPSRGVMHAGVTHHFCNWLTVMGFIEGFTRPFLLTPRL
jgi:hypothetical protein